MGLRRHPLFLFKDSSEIADAPVDGELVARLRASFAIVSAPPARLAERFYGRLFDAQPALRAMFPAEMGRQQEKLVATLRSVVERMACPAQSLAELAELGRRHAGLGVLPGHYRLVVNLLVASMAEASGGDWSPDLAADWTQTLTLMSDAMIAAGG